MEVDHVISEEEIDLVLLSLWPLFDTDHVERAVRAYGQQNFRDGIRPVAISLIQQWSRKAQLERNGSLLHSHEVPSWQRFKLSSKPSKVYRIICPSSNTSYNEERGFISRNRRHPLEFEKSLKQELTHRFNWKKTDKDDFIAVRDDEAHAIAWGKWWESEHRGQKCRIATVDGAGITMPMYRAKELIHRLDITLQFGAETLEDEFLILHRIPRAAVERVQSLDEAIDRIYTPVRDGPISRQRARSNTTTRMYTLYWVIGYRCYGIEIPERIWRMAEPLYASEPTQTYE